MQKTVIKSLFFFSISILVGCSSWQLKERCEKTNWFEYSQQVAFEGKYLEEDGFVKDCKGVDRTSAVQLDLGFKLGREKMCQYDEIYNRAKEGVPVFFKFCDGLSPQKMKDKYQEGLVLYCTSEKGYSFGKTGKLYQNLCNPTQEKVFMPSYYKGRKEYLSNLLVELGKKLVEIKTLEASYAVTETNLSREYFALPSPQECSNRIVYNEYTKKDETRYICQEAFYIRQRRESLGSSLNEIRGKLRVVRTDWSNTEKQITQTQLSLNEIPQ